MLYINTYMAAIMDDVRGTLPAQPTRFMDKFRAFIRARNLAFSTEKTYALWVKSFIHFHDLKHPKDMGATEIEAFLTHLAVNRGVNSNTQRTALNSLIFLYRQFLQREQLELNFTFAKSGRRLPTVFTNAEARAVIARLRGVYSLAARLMYGGGLRVNESVRLRVKDIDFDHKAIYVRGGKGNKDRVTLLPQSCVDDHTRRPPSATSRWPVFAPAKPPYTPSLAKTWMQRLKRVFTNSRRFRRH